MSELLNLLICPRCLNSIPVLSHTIIDSKPFIEIKCKCNDFKIQSMELDTYLSLSSRILMEKDINLERLVYLQCQSHNGGEIISYCKNCTNNLCKECEKDPYHKEHNIVNIQKLSEEINIDELIEEFEKSKNNVIINNELSKDLLIDNLREQIKTINENITQIETAYNINKNINDTLIEFVDTLIKNYNNTVRDDYLTNYNIINNMINNTTFNFNQCDIDVKNLFLSSHKLIRFFKNNFFIRKKYNDLLNIKEIIQTSPTADKKDKSAIRSILEFENKLYVTSKENINIYNVVDFKEIGKLTGHISDVNHISTIVIDEKNYILTCSDDKSIKVWDSNNYNNIFTIREHEDKVTKVIPLVNKNLFFHNTIASSSWDKTIKLINLDEIYKGNSKVLASLEGHSKDVIDILLLNDGLLLSGGKENCIKIWDLNKNNQCIHTMNKMFVSTNESIVQLDDGRIAVGGLKSIRIINLNSFEIELILNGHDLWVQCVFQNKEGILISVGFDGQLKYWDLNNGDCVYTLQASDCGINVVRVLKDEKIITGDFNGVLKIWKQ